MDDVLEPSGHILAVGQAETSSEPVDSRDRVLEAFLRGGEKPQGWNPCVSSGASTAPHLVQLKVVAMIFR